MSKKSKTAIIDTGFLIALVNGKHPFHEHAKKFYQYFLENDVSMILSTIVLSEFAIKQPITDLPLSNFRILPFNIDHAAKCFEVNFTKYQNKAHTKHVIKDDFKILSQAIVEQADLFVTRDNEFISKVIEPCRVHFKYKLRSILIDNGKEMYFGGTQLSILDPPPET